jgi:hypothetical protein
MPRKMPDLVLLAVFILVIALPLASPLPPPYRFRDQFSAPQSDFSAARFAKAAIDFPPSFSAYFEVHHLLHRQLVDALQYVRFHFLCEMVFPNVLIGKGDWLYYTGENNIADFECTSPFTPNELQAIRSRLLDWNDQLADRGIKFYIVFAPNKETIYPQFLPESVKPGVKSCRMDQVMQELQTTDLNVLDLRTSMQTASLSAQVYHRTDTHWNAKGALLAAREILSLLQQDFPKLTLPSFNEYQEKVQPFSGDLAAFLPYDESFVERSIALVPLLPPQSELEESANRTTVSSIPGSGLPRALVFHDSFSDALIPYLSEHFSLAVFAHSFSVDLDLVDSEEPDIVIYEIAQRYLTVLR